MMHVHNINHTFQGEITIGDPQYVIEFESIDDKLRRQQLNCLVFSANFAQEVHVNIDIYQVQNGFDVQLQLFNFTHSPLLTYLPSENRVAHSADVPVNHKKLPMVSPNFSLTTPHGFVEIDTIVEGYFGEVWSATDSTLVLLHLHNEFMALESVIQAFNWLFDVNG